MFSVVRVVLPLSFWQEVNSVRCQLLGRLGKRSVRHPSWPHTPSHFFIQLLPQQPAARCRDGLSPQRTQSLAFSAALQSSTPPLPQMLDHSVPVGYMVKVQKVTHPGAKLGRSLGHTLCSISLRTILSTVYTAPWRVPSKPCSRTCPCTVDPSLSPTPYPWNCFPKSQPAQKPIRLCLQRPSQMSRICQRTEEFT